MKKKKEKRKKEEQKRQDSIVDIIIKEEGEVCSEVTRVRFVMIMTPSTLLSSIFLPLSTTGAVDRM